MRAWRQPRWRLRHARDERSLGEREVLHVLAEVVLRGLLHAVASVSEVDVVQVEVEDLVLAQLLLEAPREDELLDLARQRPLGREQEQLHDLLCDGARALGRPTLGEVAEHRANDARVVQPLVLIEVRVLRRQHAEHQISRDPIHRNHRPALAEHLAQRFPVAIDDVRRLGWPVIPERGDVR